MMRRWFSRFVREEQGVVAVTAVLCMVMFVGCLGLVLDAGVLYIQRTQLQKAVDSAALAAAYDIARTGASPSSDAILYAQNNQVDPTKPDAKTTLPTNQATTIFSAGDAWTVTAQRKVPLSFAPLVGISSGTVKTTATAISSPVSSLPGTMVMPYAVWGGNSPMGLDPGTPGIIFRDNHYADDVVKPNPCGGNNQPLCNPNWNIGSNDFKGYLHKVTGPLAVGDVMSDGGNAFGQESDYMDAMCALLQKNTPAVFPVMDWAAGNGGVTLHIKGFIALKVNPFKDCGGPNGADVPWTGTVVGPYDVSSGTPNGPTNPGFPDVRVVKIWQ
jgi:Flp pilus assembly protein TadG